MDLQAVNQFKLEQREVMKKLKTDYAHKLNTLKQAKRALKDQEYDKENFPVNNCPDSRNADFHKTNPFKKTKTKHTEKNYLSSSNYTSDDELMRNDKLSPIRNPLTENPYRHNRKGLAHMNIPQSSIESSLNNSIDVWNSRIRKDKSAPRLYDSHNSLGRSRSRQNYFMGMGTATYEYTRKENERKDRNKSFIREVKNKRNYKNLEAHFHKFTEGFQLYLNSNQFNDVKDKIVILLNQSDALFEKLLDHL